MTPERISAGAVCGYIVPGKPHPLLVPERSKSWQKLRAAFEVVRREIETIEADLLLLYSTQWLSVIGHQIQADPEPRWRHVDPEWHDLGDLPYEFLMDAEFGEAYQEAARARGLHARTVAYTGFPIDTGTVVALKLLNPDKRLKASVVSCNMYADRAETLVLGKAAVDALKNTGKRAIAIAVTSLSNRMFAEPIEPSEDRISSLKDDEWNRKVLEILSEGRLEDVSQLARQFSAQANADQKLKALWWLAAVLGQHNNYVSRIFEYQPIWGTGAALVGLTPSAKVAANLEFDEEDVETYAGDREVLSHGNSPQSVRGSTGAAPAEQGTPHPPTAPASRDEDMPVVQPFDSRGSLRTSSAPQPVGAYPHARRIGDLLYLSGVGPRQAGTNAIPGGPVRDSNGEPCDYDVAAQTRSVVENIRQILEAAGSKLENIIDVTVFLIDMQRDFADFNEVYAACFQDIDAARTTIEVRALPTPIAVEFKVIARTGS